jgi:hypothetical protein
MNPNKIMEKRWLERIDKQVKEYGITNSKIFILSR